MGVRNEQGLNEIKVVGGLLVAAVERGAAVVVGAAC